MSMSSTIEIEQKGDVFAYKVRTRINSTFESEEGTLKLYKDEGYALYFECIPNSGPQRGRITFVYENSPKPPDHVTRLYWGFLGSDGSKRYDKL